MKETFTVCQTLPDGDVNYLWAYPDEGDAQDAADYINATLAERGIPSDVSCAYVV